MGIKYYYEEGMCQALNYKGQYPVQYKEITEELYQKECMACNMISDGKCTIHQSCDIFETAPAQLKNYYQLRDKKIT